MSSAPIVIIGTGLAGYNLAKNFRKLDTSTPLILMTADDGIFYSKPLLSTALTMAREPAQLAINSAVEMAEKLNATIHVHSTVQAIDRAHQTLTVNNENGQSFTQPYQKLILALGADKCCLPMLPRDCERIKSVNNLTDYRGFRTWLKNKKHVAIIGSGLVGCEFANDLSNAGVQVEVVTLEPYPLSTCLPEPMGQTLQKALHDLGVTWHFNAALKSCDVNASRVVLTTEQGDTLEVDGVLSAVGLRPHTALAEQAGLHINKGIVTNEYLQTSDPNIYALGDCAETFGQTRQYVAPLLRSADILAKILAGQNVSIAYDPMPIVLKTPACPLVMLPPLTADGAWQHDGDGVNRRALFHDKNQGLQGFVLSGDCTRERMKWVNQMTLNN